MALSDELINSLLTTLGSSAAQELITALAGLAGADGTVTTGDITVQGTVSANTVETHQLVIAGQQIVTANGNNQATARVLSSLPALVTGSGGDQGVLLPASGVGAWMIIVNQGIFAIKVYAGPVNGDGTVNFHGANGAGQVAGLTGALFYCYNASPSKWVSLNGGS